MTSQQAAESDDVHSSVLRSARRSPVVHCTSAAPGLADCRDAQLAGVPLRAPTHLAVRHRSAVGARLRQPWTLACRERELWLAARLGFRDPADLAALFDHDITGVDLDSRLDGCFLMPWEHDEPARMGSHACVIADR